MRRLAIVIACFGVMSCGKTWYHAHPDLWSNQALRHVHLKGETSIPLKAELKGRVSTRHEGDRGRGETWQDACNRLAEIALTALLQKAIQLGGNSVYLAEYRGNRHWLGRPVCTTIETTELFWKRRAWIGVRGYSAYDPALEESP